MRQTLAVLVGVVIGALALGAARFALVPVPHPPHFHANFAVFVDGARLDLSGDRFMEDVAACSVGEQVLPKNRVHLHGNDADVVHVHHDGVTWGHLFANLGMGLGDDYLALADGRVLTAGGGKTLKFVANDRPQFSVDGELIRSGDRVLISYGAESEAEVLRTQLPAVASNAEEFNARADPASCSGSHEATLSERLRHAFF